ncbi:MAG TPA: hypothetical protein VHA82_20635 [Ramlibacter sp.]|uniref:hypothetical protein n=1 Tax=Ramlibacter sp. TaxID=1917967 RepID=UPI002BE51D19|nr:hypothetical protein [Ramlibacter sp.]HVZ46223.1 hypothetical protein [Ramlibacter sp.]
MKRIAIGLAWCALASAASAAGASFSCGGVGAGDQERMKAQAAGHDMLVTFASTTGAYVADVDVRITSGRGDVVLQGHCGGPLMLVDLSGKGSYDIAATFAGKTQHKSVTVDAKPARVTFVWAAS